MKGDLYDDMMMMFKLVHEGLQPMLSEAKDADLEQQPSSVARAEIATDGAMALSDEE
eukprot:CAMPEP_0194700540 /NCGR_PEP_ID=MMETSP0295-20121207/25617_1 /TAXON_ID=39354 /ORGANISM="Heterosigma akashiwo, Strain CCMP2393" /LENGTH=56 /DNA_ID=CAMNT_0039594491 /DNA_START=97 /DNA_END=263 /DNA_ORIENTATION=+